MQRFQPGNQIVISGSPPVKTADEINPAAMQVLLVHLGTSIDRTEHAENEKERHWHTT